MLSQGSRYKSVYPCSRCCLYWPWKSCHMHCGYEYCCLGCVLCVTNTCYQIIVGCIWYIQVISLHLIPHNCPSSSKWESKALQFFESMHSAAVILCLLSTTVLRPLLGTHGSPTQMWAKHLLLYLPLHSRLQEKPWLCLCEVTDWFIDWWTRIKV